MCAYGLSRPPFGGQRAAAFLHVRFVLVPEVLQSREHRGDGGVAERAQGLPRDVVGDVLQQIEIAHLALASFDLARTFDVVVVPAGEVPQSRESSAALGRHLNGCRIGFDLGGSDRKVAALIDGRVVFSEETIWDPYPQSDPQYHYEGIVDSLNMAAAHLPRVDAIGGSAAGVYVNNRVKVASLFRGVPPDLFERRVKNIFLEIRKSFGDLPFEVVNDGEVTALAGAMALKKNGVLGIAFGTSTAGGYVTAEGNITSWLNELAFVPVDYSPQAPVDEWSGDYGCGAQYFSQQCVGRLLPVAGIEIDPGKSAARCTEFLGDLLVNWLQHYV